MRRIHFFSTSVLSLVLAGLGVAAGCVSTTTETAEDVEPVARTGQAISIRSDRFVLKLAGDLGDALRAHLAEDLPFADFPFPSPIEALNKKYKVTGMEAMFPDSLSNAAVQAHLEARAADGFPVELDAALPQLEHVFVVTVQDGTPILVATSDYSVLPEVVYAEPAGIAELQQTIPADPDYNLQWAPPLIGAETAWDHVSGQGSTIAIVDTGIEGTHPDLAPNIWTHPTEVVDGVDNDLNGFVDDVYGWDFVTQSSPWPVDPGGHGTAVAGLAAAESPLVGMAGIAYGAKLMNARAIGTNTVADTILIGKAMAYAAIMDPDVINASFGIPGDYYAIADAVVIARANNVAVVAAAGNEGACLPEMCPANLERVTAVSSSSRLDHVPSQWGVGTKIDLAAPGGGVLGESDPYTTAAGASWQTAAGTSMSAPHVSGAWALLRQQQVVRVEHERQQILGSVAPIAAPGFDQDSGHGRLDVGAAVVSASGTPFPPTANIISPRSYSHPSGTVAVEGYADVAPGTSGTYALDWSTNLAGPWTPFGGAPLSGGALSGIHTLGSLTPSTLPGPGTYLLRLTTQDGTGRRSTDYNEIRYCGNACVAAPATRAAWWRFEPGSGQSALDSEGNNHGSYAVAAGPTPLGYVGSGARFFGGDHVIAPEVDPHGHTAFAVMAWISPWASHDGSIVNYRRAANRHWELKHHQGHSLSFTTCIGGPCQTFAPALQTPTCGWTHVAVTTEPYPPPGVPIGSGQVPQTRVRMFVNGVEQIICGNSNLCLAGASFIVSTNNPRFGIGGLSPSGFPGFQGGIDEVEFYDGVVTPAEVMSTYAAGCAGHC